MDRERDAAVDAWAHAPDRAAAGRDGSSSDPVALRELLAAHFADPSSSWSIGAFGAIAEFHRDRGEPCALRAESGTDEAVAITAAGALRVRLTAASRACAYELLSARPALWLQGIVLCLPQADARRGRRAVISELGADRDAIRAADAADIVFDLGLALENVDFCVRSGDPALIAALRAASGTPLLAAPALVERLKQDSPHRIAISALGRIEVYQRIGVEGAAPPHGPHTHLLPKLLRLKRTHAANVPIPPGWLPCVSLYPANPVQDDKGRVKPFVRAEYDAFQSLLAAHGDRRFIEAKRATLAAVRAGADPRAFNSGAAVRRSRGERNAVRLALRQLHQLEGESAQLARWPGHGDAPDRDRSADAH